MKKNILKSNKGITLVALVITICGTIALFTEITNVPIENYKVGLLGDYRLGGYSEGAQCYSGYGGDGKGAYISLEDESVKQLGIN